jgi:hypothetical protein
MRLGHAPAEETGWLGAVLDEVSRDHGAGVEVSDDGMLVLRRS